MLLVVLDRMETEGESLMAKKRFSMDDYYAQLEEIRQRHRQPVVPANSALKEKLKQALLKRVPKV